MENKYQFFRHIGNISILTILSRIFGFGRDILMANLFGNSLAADAFLFAYRFPAMLRTLLIEEGFQAAFIPLYIKLDEKQAKHFTATVLVAMLILCVVLLVPALIFMPELMGLMASGFKERGNSFELLVLLARILFCYFAFLLISAVFVNLLQSHKKFIATASLPLFISIGLIISMLLIVIYPAHPWVLAPVDKIVWLAVAVIIAGFFQMLFIIGVAMRAKLTLNFAYEPAMMPLLGQFFKKMLPVMLGKSSVQITFLINQILIIGTGAGALSTFYYAERMMHLPIGIFIIAIATVLLPYLSHQLQHHHERERISAQHYAMTAALLLTMPAMIAFMVLAPIIMLTLFQHGAFGVEAARISANVLICLAPGLPAIALIKIQTTILFAHHDTKTPFIVTVVGAIFNVVLAIILIKHLSYLGVAIASTLSLSLQSIALIIILMKKRLYIFEMIMIKNIIKIIIACIIMAGTLWALLPQQNYLIDADFSNRFVWLLALVFSGGIIYMMAILLLRVFTMKEIKHLFIGHKNSTRTMLGKRNG